MSSQLKMWFSGTDALWLAWAAGTGTQDPSIGWMAHPLAAGVWKGLFALLGFWYPAYQFIALLLWFAALGLFARMLEQWWGRRRPAVVAAVLAGTCLLGSAGRLLGLAELGLACELVVGFAAVAMAASGWRRGKLWPVAAAWPLLIASCWGSPSALVYMPGLYLGAATAGWNRRGPLSHLALAPIGVAVVVGACAWSVAGAMDAWTPAAAFDRLGEHRASTWELPTGVILSLLAALAGLAQGMRLQWRAWPVIAGLGAAMAVAFLALEPLAVAAALMIMCPRAWPFALWAAVQFAVDLLGGGTGIMLTGFAYVPLMILAIWRSPLAVWSSRAMRRMDPTGRKLVYACATLAAVLLAAHSDRYVDRRVRALHRLGRRQRMHEAIVPELVGEAAANAHVLMITYKDMGLEAEDVEAMDATDRAERIQPFTAAQYDALLGAAGRSDLRVITLADGVRPGDWLVVTSRSAKMAAAAVMGPLGTPRVGLSEGDLVGGLWRIEQLPTLPSGAGERIPRGL